MPGRLNCLKGIRAGKISIPAAAAAGMESTEMIYCFVMVQTTADFGVV